MGTEDQDSHQDSFDVAVDELTYLAGVEQSKRSGLTEGCSAVIIEREQNGE